VVYDAIGVGYTKTRRPDPRISAQINRALGDARSVINVGAGSGSYEPPQTVLAVEPSPVMISQRPTGSAPAVRAFAEALPVATDTADAAMALLTMHHWSDPTAGITELWRVARRRIVMLTWEQRVFREFWLVREYLPQAAAIDDTRAISVAQLVAVLNETAQRVRIETVAVPHDCADGFAAAYWRRPSAYLDPAVRSGISMFAQTDDELLRPGLRQLATDLDSGRWHEHHQDLLRRDQLDAGYRLVIADQPLRSPGG
jgi:SAM-dependent methyltransferase